MNNHGKYNPLTVTAELLRGAAIGIANIIPGVSGGTLALLLGIYERLIAAIKSISASTVFSVFGLLKFNKKALEKFKEEMRKIDAMFLILLTVGAAAAIIALASLMTYLLEKQHDPTYGFFFGLVAVSVIVPCRMMKKKRPASFITALLAVILVIGLSVSMSGDRLLEKEQKKLEIKASETVDNESAGELTLLRSGYLFVVGGISVSAMILPGISGSFLLLLFGVYFDILRAITTRDFPVLAVFAAGCVLGLLLFTRLLNWLLAKWHDQTMGFLMGLVLGSLWAIWPFKTTAVVGEKTIYLSNTFPGGFGANELITIATFLIGALIVAGFILLEEKLRKAEEE